MKIIFKATNSLLVAAREDLSRRHPFAHERVGFISVHAASTASDLILIAEEYHSVRDEDYLLDHSVGAMMGQEALRRALNIALLAPVGMIHVHIHGHRGQPRFSRVDLREQLKFVPDFFKIRPQMPHGALVLSHDCARGRIWLKPDVIVPISEFVVVGPKMSIEYREPRRIVDFQA